MLLAVLLCGTVGCSLTYTLVADGPYDIGISKLEKQCFLAGIDLDREGLRDLSQPIDLALPDTYGGYPVVALGGYFGRGVPCRFGVSTALADRYPDADSYFCTDVDNIEALAQCWDRYDIVDYTVRLVLPAGLQRLERVESMVEAAQYNQNGATVVHILRARYHLQIDETNPYFYTLQGHLYNKKTDEEYTQFCYA